MNEQEYRSATRYRTCVVKHPTLGYGVHQRAYNSSDVSAWSPGLMLEVLFDTPYVQAEDRSPRSDVTVPVLAAVLSLVEYSEAAVRKKTWAAVKVAEVRRRLTPEAIMRIIDEHRMVTVSMVSAALYRPQNECDGIVFVPSDGFTSVIVSKPLLALVQSGVLAATKNKDLPTPLRASSSAAWVYHRPETMGVLEAEKQAKTDKNAADEALYAAAANALTGLRPVSVFGKGWAKPMRVEMDADTFAWLVAQAQSNAHIHSRIEEHIIPNGVDA